MSDSDIPLERESMKVSELTIEDVARFLRLDFDDLTREEKQDLQIMLEASIEYISDYTGIPKVSKTEKCLDDYKKFVLCVNVLCQDMYDNRSYYVDKNNVNKVVESILNMHSINLV